MEYIAEVIVTLKEGIRDSQGIVIDNVLKRTTLENNPNTFVGKYIMLTVTADTYNEALNKANKICQEVLINPVLEKYEIRSLKRE